MSVITNEYNYYIYGQNFAFLVHQKIVDRISSSCKCWFTNIYKNYIVYAFCDQKKKNSISRLWSFFVWRA